MITICSNRNAGCLFLWIPMKITILSLLTASPQAVIPLKAFMIGDRGGRVCTDSNYLTPLLRCPINFLRSPRQCADLPAFSSRAVGPCGLSRGHWEIMTWRRWREISRSVIVLSWQESVTSPSLTLIISCGDWQILGPCIFRLALDSMHGPCGKQQFCKLWLWRADNK